MNAFDLIVTVALGSTLATALLTEQVAFAEGVLGFAVLIGLQFAMTWLSVRSRLVSHLIKGEPLILVHRGEMFLGALRGQRVVEVEIPQAVRETGLASLDGVEAVVLETDGTFSVVKKSVDSRESTALANLVALCIAGSIPAHSSTDVLVARWFGRGDPTARDEGPHQPIG